MKRIFISIPVPEEIKKEILAFKKELDFLPAKWVEKENIHLTILFLGYLKNEEKIKEVLDVCENASRDKKPFSIFLKKAQLFPKKSPRLFWVSAEKSDELSKLKEDIEKGLLEKRIPFQKEERDFKPHITLARIKKWQLREMEQMPNFEENVNLSFLVSSFDVMESKLRRQGPEYIEIKKFYLK